MRRVSRRVRQVAQRVGGLALLLSFTGCIGAGGSARSPSRPVNVFPGQADLARLPSLPAPSEAFSPDDARVDSWSFSSAASPADAESGYTDASPWGDVARALATAHKGPVRLSPALRCAAEELARFYVDKHALPTESLRRFAVARCGGSYPDSVPLIWSGSAPDALTDAALFAQIKGTVAQGLEKHLNGEARRRFGLAPFRAGGHYAIAAVVGNDEVELEDTPRTADPSRRVVVRGTLHAQAADATAVVNRGDYAAETCERDTRVALPAFAFSCLLAPGDRAAWMQILVRREGRVLEDTVADLLLSEGDPSLLAYHARPAGAPVLVSTKEAFASALLGAVNQVRSDGGLGPFTLATKQTAENARLAGTFVDASLKEHTQDADSIALGLIAGWNVDGMIRSGTLFTAIVSATRDARAWLDYALERPFGRTVLLDPQARQIAIGPVLPSSGAAALGAVVTTYALFESANHDADVARAWARVAATRQQLGRPAFARLDDTRELVGQGQLVLAGSREPSEALDVAMRAVAERTGQAIEGFFVETNDLDRTPIPDRILGAEGGSLAVVITHHRVKGAAWGQCVILYLLVREGAPVPGVQT